MTTKKTKEQLLEAAARLREKAGNARCFACDQLKVRRLLIGRADALERKARSI